MDISSITKYLIFFGIILLVTGSFLFFVGRLGIDFGKLPGDIVIKKENFTFYFPLATSIILSILLTVLINLFIHK
ncbi:MAG: DUF2905 domain-containing protein [Candidatus Melainabacteria bacterium]|nr:DUF2905 domain-containing protein [Candidatus Melainabacteria bacterium]MBI3309261.1 DUF2905 domain-containing protein [Candidatus Melainabacteria bacterium]